MSVSNAGTGHQAQNKLLLDVQESDSASAVSSVAMGSGTVSSLDRMGTPDIPTSDLQQALDAVERRKLAARSKAVQHSPPTPPNPVSAAQSLCENRDDAAPQRSSAGKRASEPAHAQQQRAQHEAALPEQQQAAPQKHQELHLHTGRGAEAAPDAACTSRARSGVESPRIHVGTPNFVNVPEASLKHSPQRAALDTPTQRPHSGHVAEEVRRIEAVVEEQGSPKHVAAEAPAATSDSVEEPAGGKDAPPAPGYIEDTPLATSAAPHASPPAPAPTLHHADRAAHSQEPLGTTGPNGDCAHSGPLEGTHASADWQPGTVPLAATATLAPLRTASYRRPPSGAPVLPPATERRALVSPLGHTAALTQRPDAMHGVADAAGSARLPASAQHAMHDAAGKDLEVLRATTLARRSVKWQDAQEGGSEWGAAAGAEGGDAALAAAALVGTAASCSITADTAELRMLEESIEIGGRGAAAHEGGQLHHAAHAPAGELQHHSHPAAPAEACVHAASMHVNDRRVRAQPPGGAHGSTAERAGATGAAQQPQQLWQPWNPELSQQVEPPRIEPGPVPLEASTARHAAFGI
jgi:hypothetical protein